MQKIEAGQFEDLFEEQLRQFDTDRGMLPEERKNQDQIEDRLRDANNSFTNARKGDSSTAERERALQELENGYLKYKEIISNIDVGRKFYNDLAKLVSRFREDCKNFVNQRRVEASQMETDIANTAAMSSLNITQPPPPRRLTKNPAIHFSPMPMPSPPTEEPLAAPQPTRAPISPPGGGMWSPEMGIKFGAPTQMNSHAAPYPEARTTGGQWDPSRGVRFS